MQTPSMSGKTVVVTGGNSGIGLETAMALSAAGAKTVITARDASKGSAAVEQIRARSQNPDVNAVVFDLASLASVRDGAAKILERCPRIDVLVNNAGLMQSVRSETADGFETTFGVNHLGPFLLTALLLERIKESAPARIVNVASDAHKSARGGLHFDDLQSTRGYRGMQVYGRSKLANIYFTSELAERLAGTGVTVNCLHPGTVSTGFARDGDSKGVISFGIRLVAPLFLTPEKGARTSIFLASSAEVEGVTGQYFVKCKQEAPSRAAQDRDAARQLWEVSESLVGLDATKL
jgi:NAD(P)-dependent dehydrogenase (short-subunit alcohol dehydrogenase family)